MSGWILISRAIKGHWIWKDPERLKWWIDLIITANFEPSTEFVSGQNIFCGRGQLITTQSGLSRQWKADYHVIHRFLRKLEGDGMIRIEGNTHWTRITIVNYDEYQLSAKPITKPINSESMGYEGKRKGNRKTESKNAKPITKPINSESMGYEGKRKGNRKTESKNAKPIAKPIAKPMQNQDVENQGDMEGSAKPIATPAQNQSQPSLINNINNIYSLSHIGESEQKFIDELKNSQTWLELIAMRFQLNGIDDVRKWLDDFSLEIGCKGTVHQNLNDIRSHFHDWLRIRLSNEKKETENAANRKGSENKRRGSEVTASSGQDYEGDF